MSSDNLLLKVLNKYNSLVEMSPKVPARDKESLSLVYTPGVAEACNIIKQKPDEVYNLTNKGNTLFIITDGSATPCQEDPKNYSLLPYLETLAVFYKQVANIDAYPILLDSEQSKTAEDIFEVLDNFSPGATGFELYGVDDAKAEKVAELVKNAKIGSFLVTPAFKRQIDETLKFDEEKDSVKSHTLVAAFLRAALDNRVGTSISKELTTKFVEATTKCTEHIQKDNYYELSKQAAFNAATLFAEEKLANNYKSTPEIVRDRLERYYVEGPKSWLNHIKFDYLDESHSYKDNAIALHRVHSGVTEVKAKLTFRDISAFSQLFSKKNLAEVRDFIKQDPARNAYKVTMKNNMCSIITNGTAILGLGDIGPAAGLPVMEGKSVLFKQLAGVDVVPILIKEKDAEKVINLVAKFGHTWAAINLEDIKAPECFRIETGLQEKLDIPVFHDDQHGTAVVSVAALVNALKLTKKKPEDIKLVINGGGAAGIAITELLIEAGVKDIIICDTKGAIYEGRPINMNEEKNKLAKLTNKDKKQGNLEEIVKGTDVFLGVSVGNVLTKEMVKSMNKDPIIIALANPEPEILPDDAKEAGAAIICTGRSDFPNQVNNSLVFPGIFRGAIDIRAWKISVGMKMAAVYAIAGLIKDKELNPGYIIPGALDYQVPLCVCSSVVKTGMQEGVAIRKINLEAYKESFKYFILHGEFNQAKDLTQKGEQMIRKFSLVGQQGL